MARDFTAIDMAIQQVIGTKGTATFHVIASNVSVSTLAEPLAERGVVITTADRVVDRRLQALRKAGSIEHTRAGWVLKKA